MDPQTTDQLITPAALVDVDRMRANLESMAEYTRRHGLALRPHIKTHKIAELAREQLRLGAVGVTVATGREARVMAAVATDILMAYPPVGGGRIDAILGLPESVAVTVGLDSAAALDALSGAATRAGRVFGVLIEMDLGMHRVGLPATSDVVSLARRAHDAPGIEYRGVMFYPGHIRQGPGEQRTALEQLDADLSERLDRLRDAGLGATVVSGGSTPTAFASHHIRAITEIRPGTYIFNDRTTAEMGACGQDDCAFTILATVVSTAVTGQAVVDAGSKALGREPLRAADGGGFGALLDRPDVTVCAMSEEHGILDLAGSDWRPVVGERVRIVPNHVCYAVNLQPQLWAVSGPTVQGCWQVAARGWTD